MRWPVLIASAALALAPIGALAHGGGVDGSGCHTNSKTGDYHCHGGTPSTGGGGGGFSGGNSGGSRGSIYIAPAPKPAQRRSQPKPVAPAVIGPASLVSVGDGDTIRVTGANGQKVTIRMACIDAPETAQGESGAQATLVLKQLLGAGPVEIRPQTVHHYERTVAKVYAGGRNINLEMVRLGMAYAYRQYLCGCNENANLGVEAQA
jgi:micrococcal nuclease